MIILLVAICTATVIAAYAILRVAEWLERRANKKFPTGKINNKKGEK